MKYLLALLLLSSAACYKEPSVERVNLPNGYFGAVVHCSRPTECMRESSRVCHNYQVMSADDQPVNHFHNSVPQMTEYLIQCNADHKEREDDSDDQAGK